MKTIEEIKELLKDCSWNAEPRKKSKCWGMYRSSSMDCKTEQEAWNVWYEYCLKNGQVK